MSAYVNDRDVLITSGDRLSPLANASMYLSASGTTFYKRADGTHTPDVITVQANLVLAQGPITFSCTGATLTNVTDHTADIAFSSVTGTSLTVTATAANAGDPKSQTIIIGVVSDGSAGTGTRGAGHYYATGSSWSDVVAQAACPGGPKQYDVVTISNGTNFVMEKQWDGTNWNVDAIVLDGNLLVPGSVTTSKINANGLIIRDTAGNPLFGVNVPLAAANFGGTLGGDNLLNNSSFEVQDSITNRPSGYLVYNNGGSANATYLNVPGRTGGKAFAIRANASSSSTFGLTTSGSYTDPDVTGGVQGGWQPNKTYVVSFKAKKVNGANMQPMMLQWNTPPANVDWVNRPTLSTNWQTYTFRVVWGASVESNGQLYIDCTNGGIGSVVAGDEFHLDELIVQEGDVYSEWFPSSREAKQAADTANAAIANISSDNVLSRGEKPAANQAWTVIYNERGGLQTQASALGVDSTDYTNKFNTLQSYLVSLGSGFTDYTTDYTIDGSTFSTNFANYYQAKQALINAMAAKAATLANWVNVSGVGRPADNASADIKLIARGSCSVSGNFAAKPGGVANWDSDVYSVDSFTGGAYASAVVSTTAGRLMFGLNSDPTTDASYTSIDYAIYLNGTPSGDGHIYIYESGAGGVDGGAYAVDDILAVVYDGSSVKYLKNGSVFYTSTAPSATTPNQKLFLDSAFLDPGVTLSNIRFGPMSSNNWANVGGANKPENNATVGATIGVDLGGQITSGNASTYIASAAIQSAMINDLRTSGYTEDGSGNPTNGAKMASGNTALKVAAGSFQIGQRLFTDYWFRLLQGIDGSYSNGRVIWRGNNDVSTRGGAPDISRLSMTSEVSVQSAYTASSYLYAFGYTLTPTSYSSYTDNLDAMSSIHLQLFHNATDSTPNSEIYASCGSRTYDGNTGAMRGSVICWDRSGFNGPYGYAGYVRVRIANSYGWSATKDLGPATSPGGTLPSATITGVGGSTGGGSGDTSGGGGGACPAPWVKVILANGKEVNAGALHDGARVMAVNDNTMLPVPDGAPIRDVCTIWAKRYSLKLTNGEVTEWSENHRFAVLERGWVHVQHLLPGDHIIGQRECIVESIIFAGEGQVVSFRVERAGTYFAGGMLCHNLKTPG